MAAVDATILVRATLRGAPRPEEALATRLAVANALASADLRPAGLPPAAVLIIDHLAAPAGRPLALRGGGRVDPGWERVQRAAVADLHRRAARPLDGPVAPGCPAVLFADQAELLACLALDVSLGRAGERWWWRSYRQRWGGLARDALPAVLLEWPRSLPAALRLLHPRGQAEPLVQALSPAETRQLLAALCHAFQLAPPHLPAHAAGPAAQPLTPAGPAGEERPTAGRDAPWRAWLAAGDPVAALESECLLGVALALAHAPSVARTEGFRSAVEAWWQREQATAGRPSRHRPAHVAWPEAAGPRDEAARAAAFQDPPRPAASEMDAPPTGGDRAAAAQAQASASPDPARPRQPQPRQQVEPPAAPNLAAGPVSAEAQAVQPEQVAEDRPVSGVASSAALARAADLAGGVLTELGGVLFLINVMQRLDLPACFEAEWRLGSVVGPWGVLELLGRGLLTLESPPSRQVGDFAEEPLWAALAAIDGRQPGQLPAAQFTAPRDSLRIPAAWLAWLDDAAADQVVDLAALAPLDGPLLAGVDPDLRGWLAAVAPLLRQMLQRALGDDADPVADLLLRRGQLYVTSSHVDLVLPLAGVSLLVRRAGLDFDPGWLPAWGRVVRFHYE
jgi:hypothetical protein